LAAGWACPGYRWLPDNRAFNQASEEIEAAQTLGEYINEPFTYDFDITRNGQDYSALDDRQAAGEVPIDNKMHEHPSDDVLHFNQKDTMCQEITPVF
jgi:hypothetical protein